MATTTPDLTADEKIEAITTRLNEAFEQGNELPRDEFMIYSLSAIMAMALTDVEAILGIDRTEESEALRAELDAIDDPEGKAFVSEVFGKVAS